MYSFYIEAFELSSTCVYYMFCSCFILILVCISWKIGFRNLINNFWNSRRNGKSGVVRKANCALIIAVYGKQHLKLNQYRGRWLVLRPKGTITGVTSAHASVDKTVQWHVLSPQHHNDPTLGVYIIDRYTYYALEFLEGVTPDSKKTMGQFVSNKL